MNGKLDVMEENCIHQVDQYMYVIGKIWVRLW